MRTTRAEERRWDRAVAAFAAADAAADHGDLPRAQRLAARAVRGLASSVGEAHPDHGNAMLLLGRIVLRRGQARRALSLLSAAADQLGRIRTTDPDISTLAVDARLAVASCLQALGELPSARRHGRRALALATRRVGPRHVLAAMAHNQLGVIAKFAGAFGEAEHHYARALPVYRRAFGPRSREVATILHNLGGLDHARGRFTRGERWARTSVEIGRRLLPPGDPERVAHEVAHAGLLDGLGQHHRTLPIYRRALRAFERHFGRDHYERASTLHNLAAAEHALGRRGAARRHYRETERILLRVRGGADPDLALTRYNLALLERDAGRVRVARDLLGRALATFRARLAARHPHVVACREALTALSKSEGGR